MHHRIKIDPEFQALIPPQSEDERAELEASILAEGCRDALIVWAGHDILIDGHHRYAICSAHGIPFDVVEREFEDRDAVREWIIRNQFARRNLTPYTRAVLALRLKDILAERARRASLANLKNAPEGDRLDVQNSGHRPAGRVDDQLADVAGTSHDTIHKVATVESEAPEPVRQAARAGDISTHRAYQLTTALRLLPEADRIRAAQLCGDDVEKARTLVRLYESSKNERTNDTYSEIMMTGGFAHGPDFDQRCDFAADSLSEIERALKSVARAHAQMAVMELRQNAPALPDGIYNVVLADPPWEYSNSGFAQSAAQVYPTMPTEAICALNVAQRVDKNAVLFLWATSPLLPDALRVMAAWGFEYKASMVWRKNRAPGIAFWVNTYHEILLIGERGSYSPVWKPDSVIDAPVSQHSRKPDQVYEIIERMYPNAQYLELFARRARPGWAAFGNDPNLEGGHNGDTERPTTA